METLTVRSNEKNYASLIHLSTLTKYFIPFGNYILPTILWGSKKESSEFINHNGKQALNFQLSILLYSIVLLLISIPSLIYSVFNNVSFDQIENGDFILEKLASGNITGVLTIAIMSIVLFGLMKVAEFFLIIYAAVKSNEGEYFNYPMTIPFLK